MDFESEQSALPSQLASLYHNRHTRDTILTVPKNDINFEKNYDMITLTARLCSIGLHYFD